MGHGLRVVVADDEPVIREMVGAWLEQLGHVVTTVGDGATLLAACRADPPDLVVSDVRMPALDGLAAAAVLRTELAVPVVLISGNWEPAEACRADELGVTRLAKPIRPLELVRAISEICPRDRPADAGDALFRQLVETAEDVAIFTLDPRGRVSHWNRGAARLFGYEPAEVLGRGWERLFFPADRSTGAPARELAQAAAAGAIREERWHIRKDGSEFWASGTLVALRGPDGAVAGYGKIVRDRTDLKKQEAALQAQADALRRADAWRTAALATLAHELRNALTPLLTYSRVLQDGPGSADVARVAGRVERQVRLLARLVDDLTDAARVCEGKVSLDRRRTDLCAVVGQAAEAAGSRCAAAGHTLALDLPPDPVWLDGDPDRLAQVAANLLGNAVKYTPQPGRIAVAVTAVDGWATLRVRDTGVGIAADQLEAVFDLFTQDDRHRAIAQGGLGVGLAVVRELVERHGGSVHAASDGDGHGSEFVVRLPVCGSKE